MSFARNALQLLVVTAFTGLPLAALAAKPTAKEALSLTPVQKDVEYDIPDAKEIEKCTVDVIKVGGFTGYAVLTDSGQILRRFLDTNGDNRVDQWCYFKDGIEVYRDIDGNFNNKADQYRWLGTAGTRWGLDDDENGKIDSWKVISAEEVTGEVVAALRDRDAARFQRLLLSSSDLQSLGLASKQVTELGDKIEAAVKSFMAEAGRQKIVTAKSEWVHFGANRPGIVPAGTEGSTKDIIVYDNVTAVVETDKKHGQLNVGTLVKVGDAWKLFDLPKMGADQAANAADQRGTGESDYRRAPADKGRRGGGRRRNCHEGSSTRAFASALSTPSAMRRGRSPKPKAAAGSPRGSTSITFVLMTTSIPFRVRPRITPLIGACSMTRPIDAMTVFSSTRSPMRALV